MDVVYDEDNLWIAAGEGDVQRTLRFLQGAHPDLPDEYGYTPLMAASSYGKLELVLELLRLGADPNKRDNDGNTSIHHCDFVDCLRALQQHGGDSALRNSEGQTALEVKQAELEEGVVVEEHREAEEEYLDGELSRLVAALLEFSVLDEAAAAAAHKKPKQMELEEL